MEEGVGKFLRGIECSAHIMGVKKDDLAHDTSTSESGPVDPWTLMKAKISFIFSSYEQVSVSVCHTGERHMTFRL